MAVTKKNALSMLRFATLISFRLPAVSSSCTPQREIIEIPRFAFTASFTAVLEPRVAQILSLSSGKCWCSRRDSILRRVPEPVSLIIKGRPESCSSEISSPIGLFAAATRMSSSVVNGWYRSFLEDIFAPTIPINSSLFCTPCTILLESLILTSKDISAYFALKEAASFGNI